MKASSPQPDGEAEVSFSLMVKLAIGVGGNPHTLIPRPADINSVTA